jgi:hypothetical protein
MGKAGDDRESFVFRFFDASGGVIAGAKNQ